MLNGQRLPSSSHTFSAPPLSPMAVNTLIRPPLKWRKVRSQKVVIPPPGTRRSRVAARSSHYDDCSSSSGVPSGVGYHCTSSPRDVSTPWTDLNDHCYLTAAAAAVALQIHAVWRHKPFYTAGAWQRLLFFPRGYTYSLVPGTIVHYRTVYQV